MNLIIQTAVMPDAAMIWRIVDILMARCPLQCDGQSTSLLTIPPSELIAAGFEDSHHSIAETRENPNCIIFIINNWIQRYFGAISSINPQIILYDQHLIQGIRSVLSRGISSHGTLQTGRLLYSRCKFKVEIMQVVDFITT